MENSTTYKQLTKSHLSKEAAVSQSCINDANLQYYHLYQALQKESQLLYQHFLRAEAKHNHLANRTQTLSDKANSFKDVLRPQRYSQKKNVRRGGNELYKRFICTYSNCKLAYGSKTSYRAHLKIKHPQQYVSKKQSRTVNT